MDSFVRSVERFLDAADWLDESDQPMITALQQAAETLDRDGVQAALLNTFGVTYRTLLKKRENGTEGFNDDEDFLNGL